MRRSLCDWHGDDGSESSTVQDPNPHLFSGGEIEGEGTVLDLSRGGCRVECETELSIGDEVEAWV
ncbi:PilZ domain-containing protein [Nitrospira calida]